MLGDPLVSIRAALNATSNTTGGDTRSGIGGNEIQKMIERMVTDDVNRGVDLRPLIVRKPMNQLTYLWNIQVDLGSSNKSAFYSDGGSGTQQPSTRIQYIAIAKALRSDYGVTGLAQAAGFFDLLESEARDAVDQMALNEEDAFISGTDTSAYGLSGAYPGLLQLMGSNATFTDTDTIYGIARTGARDELDVSLVAAGATTQDALSTNDLDSAIQISDDKGAKGNRRIFFGSTARGFEINQLLRPHGQFIFGAGSLELEGGVKVTTYMGFPIVTSRRMDKNGITWNGSTKTLSFTDAAMYMLDLTNIEFRVIGGVDMRHVPILGSGSDSRADETGGYFKTYGTLVMKRFTTQVLIYNLSVP